MVAVVGQSGADAAVGGVYGFAPALTSFVGRAEAVREVAGLLDRYRLVTVTGPGGSGKTRLAAEVAGLVADQFADGVWLAELAAARDAAEVPAVVAAALRVREQPGVPVIEAVARALARQQLLLVLDNCEHLIGAAARLCGDLLPAADDVRVLATSREPLRVGGEARYRLAPLTLPGPHDATDAGRSEAVALFADRARRADARFTLDDQTRPTVARLVRRLDGMPLAIELAAARVEALGVTQLVACLDDRFSLLTGGDRLAPSRQRSLSATVEWSYQLLDERERSVFRAVSIFPGPFTLEGSEAVAGQGAGLAMLRLVDCSLVVPPRADPDGRSRYVMLETLRAYGARLLAEAGEQEQAAAALAGHALQIAEQAEAGLQTGTAEAAAARWLDAEDATMRQALAWALQHDAAAALRLALAMAPWLFLRGRAVSGYPLLRQAAEKAVPGSDGWCTAHFWLGEMALYSADLTGALDHFTAVRDALEGRPPHPALADCLACRSGTLANLGRIAEATDDGRRALALAQTLGYPAGEALALVTLSIAAYYDGDLGAALQIARQAQQIPADIPGWIARADDIILTVVLTAAGDLSAAERTCAAGLDRARDVGDVQSQGSLLTHMAILDVRAGRFEDTADHLREALQIAMRSCGRLDMLTDLDCCGHLCAATGRAADAVTVWAAYEALVHQEGFTDPPTDAASRAGSLREARRALGDTRARAAEQRGATMTFPTAAEYALMLITTGPQPQEPPELAGLSARERELVTLVAQGRTDAQIAAELFISVRTVGSHLDRIRDKTGYRRRADLTRLALTAGLV